MPSWGDFGTDLASERRHANITDEGVVYQKEKRLGITIEHLQILSGDAERTIGRPKGVYNTLCTERFDCLSPDREEALTSVLAEELYTICAPYEKNKRVLFAGLGNASLTPDSIGPRSAAGIRPTRHIKNTAPALFASLGCHELSVLCPGVTGQTGLEACEVLAQTIRALEPDFLIAVDALAARATERLGTTLQLSDTGIFPGGGVKNHRTPLTKKTLGCPVIAIGIPTVCDGRYFFFEEAERQGLGEYAQMPAWDNIFVSPREIDEITAVGAKIIADAANRAFGIAEI